MTSNYDNYKPMIQLGIRINESGIFTNEDIISYTLDFDSEGNEKRMPLTASNLEFYVNEFNNTIKGENVYLMYGSRPFLPSGLDLDNTYTNTLMGLILYQSQKESISKNIPIQRNFYYQMKSLMLNTQEFYSLLKIKILMSSLLQMPGLY